MSPTLQLTIVAQLGLAALLGAVIGFERESRNHIAGIRTHALVSAGAALFAVAGAYGFADLSDGLPTDPMRVAAQVASGIGFIGAGAIIRNGRSVRGVTTAATLWLSAAVGIAAGAGLWLISIAAVAMTIVVLIGFRALERRGFVGLGTTVMTLELKYRQGHDTLGPLLRALEPVGKIRNITVEDEELEAEVLPDVRRVSVRVATRDKVGLERIVGELRQRDEVISARLA